MKICNLLNKNRHLSSTLFIGGYRSYLSEQAKPKESFFSLLSASCTFLRTWLESPQEYGIFNPQAVQYSIGVPPH